MSLPTPPPSTTLSSKCSICFTSAPKYRCPRCAARTCSLACVRTHKSRSLCSGIRDATGYLSRRQLATDKAFDSDFNLISSIERGVERAERIFAVPSGNPSAERRVRKAVERAGVTVWRAPKGVKRARENRTGIDGRRQCIRWTLEWRFLGLSVVSVASEMGSLIEAHDVAVLDAYASVSEKDAACKIAEYAKSVGVVMPSRYRGRRDLVDALGLSASRLVNGQDEDTTGEVMQESTIRTVDSDAQELRADSEPKAGEAVSGSNIEVNPQSTNTNVRKFFIHRPEISSASKQIVAPVDGTSSIRDVLKGKTVREFPTFIVEVSDFDQIDWTHWHLEDELGNSKTVQT